MKTQTLGDRIVDLLETQGNLSASEIKKALNITSSSLYSAVHAYNAKKTNRRVFCRNTKYRITGKSTCKFPSAPVNEKAMSIKSSSIHVEGLQLQTGVLKKLKALPRNELEDCLDMLKKSEFYNRSAVALIEVNESIMSLRNSLLQED
jgi:chloramphenicol 3-O-phosphotransferase